jgi:glycosyltransferase involved in cell wall biosynthesis
MAKKKIKRASICLVMIVKNESAVIKRCIDSVKDYIDYWVICDTGSTDGTQKIIQDLMDDYKIPGELHETEWKDFGRNRTESLNLSFGKSEYRLIIDADDYLSVTDPDKLFVGLDKDAYKVKIVLNETSYYRYQIVRSNHEWKYVGVLHEYIDKPKDLEIEDGLIEEAVMIASVSGDTKEIKGATKYHNDALIFEKEIATNPDLEEGLKTRYQFYIGQSYRDAQMYDRSIEAYQKRVDMGGWEEEVYISLYMIAKMKAILKKPDIEIQDAFMTAWEYRPVRLEAAYHLVRFLISRKKNFIAFTIASMCMRMQPCEDVLFVEPDIWLWKLVDEYSVLSYLTGNIKEAYSAAKSITELEEFQSLPESDRDRISNNLKEFEKVIESMKK